MKRARQLGQSMTEYLVVLGVTGAALLAVTTDVTRIFDTVKDGYAAQSREMNKVQLYNSQKVRFNDNPPSDEDFDDGDTPPPYDEELPDPGDQLPSVEIVYDQHGNQIGRMDGDMLVDEAGNILAWCQRNDAGDCTFVDANGNEVFPGAGSQRHWVDENGNPLPMMAILSGSRVVGFAYFYKGRYYSAYDRKLLDPQPTGVSHKPMRTVVDLGDSGPEVVGYELNGRIYALKQTLVANPTFDSEQSTEKAELVSVYFAAPPSAKWNGYKPCLLMPSGWNDLLNNGEQLSGEWEKKFNDPSRRLDLGPIKGVGGFIDATPAGCGGASSVTFDAATGKWTLSK